MNEVCIILTTDILNGLVDSNAPRIPTDTTAEALILRRAECRSSSFSYFHNNYLQYGIFFVDL